MKKKIINAFAWLLVQCEEILATAWGWIDSMEHAQHDRECTDDAMRLVADDEAGDYTVVVSEQTVYEITKHENAVHLPRRRVN